MITVLDGLPPEVLGVEATGEVSGSDYEDVVVPAVREKREAYGKVRFLYVLGESFEGWTADAMWEDAKLGLKDMGAWERIAVVSDKDWVSHVVRAFGWMVPGEVRLFGLADLDAAKEWVAG
jgi:hypothetical protein